MGRRKQRQPKRSKAVILESDGASGTQFNEAKQNAADVDEPYYVQVRKTNWVSNEHRDLSEVVLSNLKLGEGCSGFIINEDFYQESRFGIRLRVMNVNRPTLDRIKLGHWPLLPSSDVSLELIERKMLDNGEVELVIVSGIFDGLDEGITALVHLVSMGFLSVRPVLGVELSDGMKSLRVRVEILWAAFDACESLLEVTRQVWKKSMMNLIAWLRPEVMSSEARYGVTKSREMDVDLIPEMEDNTHNFRKNARLDVAGFYEAIKPSKSDPVLEDDLPNLLPTLRPYQRRAAYWMLQQENVASRSLNEKERAELFSPFCFPLSFLDTSSKMFYNPFSGNVSLQPEYFSLNVPGGILADEMGLGKTVELLACIFAHRRLASEGDFSDDGQQQHSIDAKVKRLKMERVECICGAVSESYRYKGLWVQCDVCDAWQHADCVGYSPRGKRKKSAVEVQKNRKKTTISFVERDGEHVCQMCSELMEATVSPILSGATLIVCPAPILSQWQAEIERHTRPGSVKTCVYEGVRDASFSCTSTMDIEELLSADIVLTTYDVLKEDLSHDSDRHEGDRHILRFQKRYPVIPTPLTRIFWWRICLDEAQMVESNACAATEMALRLSTKFRWCVTGTPIQRKLDDLYGLLRFLKASPFNVSRWWTEIIRDPYEKGDKAAITFTHKFFKNIMWRSSKVHVADELLLPPQEENLSWLTFSAIEEHFYERQHESCVNYARELIESFKSSNSKRKAEDSAHSGASLDPLITHAEAAKLLNSLLKLRQACCHPQVGSSGLRSVQQSPMTMEEILMVLIGKTKVEGEEALRKLVVALNALAGVATIKQEYTQAASLYKEALFVSEEHSEDFRLDPLLNIHIHHNLAEVLSLVTDCSTQLTLNRQQCHERSEKASKVDNMENCDATAAKRQKVSGENDYADEARSLCEQSGPSLKPRDDELNVSCDNLRTKCEKLKQKYLSVFSAKLAVARQDFRKSNMQVCNAFNDRKAEDTTWWLDALHHVEQNRDLSSELIGKVEEAVTGTKGNSRSSRTASCFQSVSALKYHVQVRLDQLETSRKTLLDQLLEIDETMDNPKEKDVERVRYCCICQAVDGGVVCIHCELDGLFKDYEARLFRLNKLHGEVITSAEEAVDLQNKKSELNRFYWNLSGRKKNLSSVSDDLEESTKRGGGESVVVSKSPSDMEVILGVIKNYCKAKLGSECVSAASKQLQMLESMRKEYGHARSLAVAQAQVLLAHDEIKMATSRLHLKEDENDQSVDALSLDELDSASVVHSSEKFMSLTELSSIKGKLRYLKGLVQTKRKLSPESSSDLLSGQQKAIMTTATGKISERLANNDEEACPICQEKLNNQKMVFQCGHVTCCKCFFELTERKEHDYKFQRKWVMCPTCRQHTDFGNIAYADDRQEKCSSSTMTNIAQGAVEFEAALTVQGSYSTKVEAVTRRILWIKSSDSKAKVLVFSSWNDVLDVLEHAFNANAITYIRMKGGRKSHVAISKFKGKKNSEKVTSNVHDQQEESKSVQVLLLLIQHGANGLNLLEAQHVVLVEPLLNPAVEAQAISRVHRIGQENKTIVHRFIVKDTVEESIYKLNRSRNMSSFISGNTKNQDQPVLTVKDVECLFGTVNSKVPQSGKQTASLRDLPPSTAAAIAAERRLKQIESGSRL